MDDKGYREYQNVTISFARDTLRKAKVIAVSNDTSVSAIMRDLLDQYVLENDSYERSRESYLQILSDRHDMGTGGHVTWKRGDLHERKP